MRNSFSLSIPKPCSQKWESFAKTEQGGFCSSCNKTVIDFTNMPEKEIIKFFNTAPTHVCGKFALAQLTHYNLEVSHSIRPGRFLLTAGFAGLLVALTAAPSFSQSKSKKPRVDNTISADQSKNSTQAEDQGILVHGLVKDEEGEPAPGINVVLMGTAVGTATDVNGRFEFPERIKPGSQLVFSFIGYKIQTFTVASKTESEINIQMKIDDVMLTGEVTVGQVYQKQSRIARIWRKTKSIF